MVYFNNSIRSMRRRLRDRWACLSGNAVQVPGRWLSSRAYAGQFSGHWYSVYPPESIRRTPPIAYGSREANFAPHLVLDLPELGVLELTDGIVVGPDGWVLGRRGSVLLPEHSWFGDDVAHMQIDRRAVALTRVRGVCLNLSSDWSSKNYGHFLLDALGRYALFEKAGFNVSDVDWVYVGYPGEKAGRLLDRLGIPKNKCLAPIPGAAVAADVLLAPSFPGVRRNYPRWLVDFIRSRLGYSGPSAGRRLYLPRTTRRRLTNESTLLKVLEKYDFDIFGPESHAEPPLVFSDADVVISGHGSALADIAFCQPGARVLELIPSDHVYPYWYTLAESGDLRYAYLVGASAQQRASLAFGPSPYDFSVDEDEFRYAVEDFLA